MEKRRAETVIDKPADEVWARIRDFGDISWIPDTEQCVVDGDVRKISREAWSFELEQRLVNHDDAARTYSYSLPRDLDLSSLIGPGKIVHQLDGTLAVTPAGSSQSVVTWDIETEDFLIPGVHAEYQHALESLKAQLEG
jgi:hypothetical protein